MRKTSKYTYYIIIGVLIYLFKDKSTTSKDVVKDDIQDIISSVSPIETKEDIVLKEVEEKLVKESKNVKSSC